MPHSRYAPRTLTTKKRPHAVEHFVEDYRKACAKAHIVDDARKCERMLQYCKTKVADMIETLPSYHARDFEALIRDLYYFLEEEEEPFSFSKLRAFVKKYHNKRMDSTKQLKHYNIKYLKLVGKAVSAHRMSEEDYDLYFWSGLPSSLQKKIENRLLTKETNFKSPKPFKMKEVNELAIFLLDRHKYDQHLLSKSGYQSSDSGSDSDDYRPKHIASDSDSESDVDSDDSYRAKKPHIKRKPSRHEHKTTPVPEPHHFPREGNEEVSKLINRMNKLSLGQLNHVDPQQKAYLVDMFRKLSDQPTQRYNPQPPQQDRYNPNGQSSHQDRYSHNPPPPRQDRYPQPPQQDRYLRNQPPPQNRYPPRDQAPHQSFGVNQERQPPRETPPHTQANNTSRPFPDRQDAYCFGCGKNGHRMGVCGELNTLINQGTVSRDSNGRIQWPDGTRLFREQEDTIVQAINKSIKRANIVQAAWDSSEEDTEEENVQQFVGITREEDDASTDSQEELGWTPGPVSDYYALGVERNPKVSREARRQVQFNIPSTTQGVKELPKHREAVGDRRQRPPIDQSIHLHSNQSGLPKRITPFDPNQNKFEGKEDSQLIPMQIDQRPSEKSGNDPKQIAPDSTRSEVLVDMVNPGPAAGKSGSEIAKRILDLPITVTVAEAMHISPNLRRDLTTITKVSREAYSQEQEKKVKREKQVFGSNVIKSWLRGGRRKLGTPRDGLLKVATKIGNAKIVGVIDSGSQVNVLSDKFVRKCGLPLMTEGMERYKISGVNGGLAEVVGIIPNARINLTNSELETIGELVVVKHSGFDLLLGRPWGTVNGAGIREANEGTYLSFDSEGGRYELMVSPNPHYRSEESEVEVSLCALRKRRRKGKFALATARATSEAYAPDSEPDRDPQIEYEAPDNSVPEEWKPDGEREREAEDERIWARTPKEVFLGGNQLDDEEIENEDEPTKEPPDLVHSDEEDNESVTIESELQESYIQMVLEGNPNSDTQWEKFCKAEKRRQNEDKARWRKWRDERKPIDETPESEMEDGYATLDTEDQSYTLTTPDPTQRTHRPPARPSKLRNASEVTAARRSSRIRSESRKARENDDKERWRRKAYARDEKQTRKTMRSRDHDRIVSSLGARLYDPQLDRYEEQEPEINIISFEKRGPADETYAASSTRTPEMEGALRTKALVWPLARDCAETTYRQGNVVVRERQLHRPQRTPEESADERPLQEAANGWNIGPGNGTCEKGDPQPWISRHEMAIALENVRDMSGSGGKQFEVHAIDPDRIAVTLASEKPTGKPTPKPENQRLIELRRESEGTLTIVPRHNVECALHALRRQEWTCRCQGTTYDPKDKKENQPKTGRLTQRRNDDRGKEELRTEARNDRPADPWPKHRPRTLIKEKNDPRKRKEKTPLAQVSPTTPNEPQEDKAALPFEALKVTNAETTEMIGRREVDAAVKRAYGCRVEKADKSERSKKQESRIDMTVPTVRLNNPPDSTDEEILFLEALETMTLGGPEEPPDGPEKEVRSDPDDESKPREYEDKAYQRGRSLYHEHHRVRSPGSREIDRVRAFNELLDWDKVYGKEENDRRDREYLLLSREELGTLIDWADGTPEYRGGGREFIIQRTPQGTLEIALIGDTREARLTHTEVCILELTRSETGQLQEIYNITSTPYNGPLKSAYEYYQRTANDQCAKSTPHDIPPEHNYATRDREDEKPDIVLKSFAATRTYEDEPEKRPEWHKLDKDRKTNEAKNLPRTRAREVNLDGYPYPDMTHEDEPNHRAAIALGISFPPPRHTRYLPEPLEPTNGLLAVRHLIPYAQYDRDNDMTFYARGATLVIDEEDGEPAYYRGNAVIRITDRDGRPGPKPPSRRKVNMVRNQLFRTHEFAKPPELSEEHDIPASIEEPPQAQNSKDASPDRADQHGDMTNTDSLRGTMTQNELEAIMQEIMTEPIEEIGERRAYKIEQQADGSIIVTRQSFDPEVWKQENDGAAERIISDERATRQGEKSANKAALTRYGNNPPASDKDSVAKQQIDQKSEGGNSGAITQARMERDRCKHEWEIPEVPEPKELKILATPKTIKQTQAVRQEVPGESLTSDISHLRPTFPWIQSPTCRPPMVQPLAPMPSQCQECVSSGALPNDSRPAPSVNRHEDLSELSEEEEIRVPPCPDPPRPGILAAAHLAVISTPGSSPLEPSFFAYGSTIALEDEKGRKLTFRGNALVHLFGLATPNYANSPRPPHPGRTESAKAYLFRQPNALLEVDDPRDSPYERQRAMERPRGSYQFDPQSPEFKTIDELEERIFRDEQTLSTGTVV